MEISQTVLIDVVLNMVGYLTAAALSVLIFNSFRGRRTAKHVEVPQENVSREDTIAMETAQEIAISPSARGVEFVNLLDNGNQSPKTNSTEPQRRDLRKVFRLAREMVINGSSIEEIKKVLPISDAELALVSTDTAN